MNNSKGEEHGKCMVFRGYDASSKLPKLSIEEFQVPDNANELSEGQVLLKILLATVCGSDLHTLSGRRKEPVPWYDMIKCYILLPKE